MMMKKSNQRITKFSYGASKDLVSEKDEIKYNNTTKRYKSD